MEYPIFEFIFNPSDEGLLAVSIVKDPAIQQEFLKFNDQKTHKLLFSTTEQQILVGPALIPGMLIYRQSEIDGSGYYGYFSKETIQQLVSNYFKSGKVNCFSFSHNGKILENITLIESWFTSENDKSHNLGYNLPIGSWMISLKVEDTELWNTIKNEDLSGFSVEVIVDAFPKEFRKKSFCPITYKDVIRTKLKKSILEAEIDRMGDIDSIKLEKYSTDCTCINCLELNKLGWNLPNVLPDYGKKEYNTISVVSNNNNK